MTTDFTKTDVYGLFKPAIGSNQWGHFLAVNLDMIDRLLAAQQDQIASLEKRVEWLMQRVVVLEEMHVEAESGHNV
jgi:hypothetical protein